MESNGDNPFEQIQKFFKDFKGDINLINEQIDIELQMEYFDYSKNNKDKELDSNWEEKSEMLFTSEVSLDDKKVFLSQLATVFDVKAYRIIEKYASQPDAELKHWALLAMQESRMLLQSKLLDQSQVFISTGLGGKGNKLRYFMVLLTNNNEPFSEYQQKLVRSEFELIFSKNESEIEEFKFYENISTLITLVPLHIPIQDLFIKAVKEINQFGNFVRKNCIITNVRIMNMEEIRQFMAKSETDEENKELEDF